jgi:hypothetical protein
MRTMKKYESKPVPTVKYGDVQVDVNTRIRRAIASLREAMSFLEKRVGNMDGVSGTEEWNEDFDLAIYWIADRLDHLLAGKPWTNGDFDEGWWPPPVDDRCLSQILSTARGMMDEVAALECLAAPGQLSNLTGCLEYDRLISRCESFLFAQPILPEAVEELELAQMDDAEAREYRLTNGPMFIAE